VGRQRREKARATLLNKTRVLATDPASKALDPSNTSKPGPVQSSTSREFSRGTSIGRKLEAGGLDVASHGIFARFARLHHEALVEARNVSRQPYSRYEQVQRFHLLSVADQTEQNRRHKKAL